MVPFQFTAGYASDIPFSNEKVAQMAKVAVEFGAHPEVAKKDMTDVLQFEVQIVSGEILGLKLLFNNFFLHRHESKTFIKTTLKYHRMRNRLFLPLGVAVALMFI